MQIIDEKDRRGRRGRRRRFNFNKRLLSVCHIDDLGASKDVECPSSLIFRAEEEETTTTMTTSNVLRVADVSIIYLYFSISRPDWPPDTRRAA